MFRGAVIKKAEIMHESVDTIINNYFSCYINAEEITPQMKDRMRETIARRSLLRKLLLLDCLPTNTLPRYDVDDDDMKSAYTMHSYGNGKVAIYTINISSSQEILLPIYPIEFIFRYHWYKDLGALEKAIIEKYVDFEDHVVGELLKEAEFQTTKTKDVSVSFLEDQIDSINTYINSGDKTKINCNYCKLLLHPDNIDLINSELAENRVHKFTSNHIENYLDIYTSKYIEKGKMYLLPDEKFFGVMSLAEPFQFSYVDKRMCALRENYAAAILITETSRRIDING